MLKEDPAPVAQDRAVNQLVSRVSPEVEEAVNPVLLDNRVLLVTPVLPGNRVQVVAPRAAEPWAVVLLEVVRAAATRKVPEVRGVQRKVNTAKEVRGQTADLLDQPVRQSVNSDH